MIYPTIYNILAQYRGPRFDSELTKFFVSTVSDIQTVNEESEQQTNSIKDTVTLHINGKINYNTSIDNTLDLNGTSQEYQSFNQLSSRLDNIELIIKQYKESIY